MPHETRIRVRYSETDQMGVAYHANYLVWMEVGRVEYCRAAGLCYKELEETDGLYLVVVEANCRYHAPARHDDELLIRTSLTEAHPRKLRFEYEIRCAGSGRKLASGHTVHVFCNRSLQPVKLPERRRAVFGMSG